jgi:RNA polymerase sigma factor (sigma-70 family)
MKKTASPSQQDLLLGLQEGDKNTIEWIYKAYWPMVAHLVRMNKGREEEAQDLYQEGFLALYERVREEDFHLTCSLKTYLYSICRNKWFSSLKTRKPMAGMEAFLERIPEEESPADSPYPDDQQIIKAIDALGDPCRALLLGYYYHQWSLEQLARKLHYAGAHVGKQQKFRCLERLRKRLQALAPEPVEAAERFCG